VPFWSATTDAYSRGDMAWVRTSMRRMHLALLAFAALLTLMLLVSGPVYRLWVGSKIHVPFLLSLGMAVYMMIIITSLCYSYFLNGFGYLRMQLITTLMSAAVYIPLSFAMGRSLGVVGVIFALCLINLPGVIINRMQYDRIVGGTARGVWKR